MLKNNYVKYVCATGEILVSGSYTSENIVCKDGVSVVYGLPAVLDPDSCRIDVESKEVVPRLEFSEGSWVGDEYTNRIPHGTKVSWQGVRYTVTDGEVTVLVDQPGKHLIYLSHPLYNSRIVELENRKFD